jgi:hypothetical protein
MLSNVEWNSIRYNNAPIDDPSLSNWLFAHISFYSSRSSA